MTRSLNVTWEDPLAAHAAGKALSGLDYTVSYTHLTLPTKRIV